jgi:hypothetical protein
MKPRSIKPWHLVVVLLVAGTSLTLLSWDRKQDTTRQHHPQSFNDTTPRKNNVREKKIRDLDEAIEELDNVDLDETMEKAMKEMANGLKSIDHEKIKKEIEDAMKKVDFEKIKEEVDKAMKEVDFDKIKADIDKTMKQIDFAQMKADMENAMKEIDFEKISREARESLEKIDWNKMKSEMEGLQKIDMKQLDTDMKKLEIEMKNLEPRIKKEMEKAKVEIEKVKTELKEYKQFVDGLEKDGLLNKKESYTIKHKDGQLTVNGKIVSDQVYSKYRSFLDKHKSFNIEKDDEDFDIDMD